MPQSTEGITTPITEPGEDGESLHGPFYISPEGELKDSGHNPVLHRGKPVRLPGIASKIITTNGRIEELESEIKKLKEACGGTTPQGQQPEGQQPRGGMVQTPQGFKFVEEQVDPTERLRQAMSKKDAERRKAREQMAGSR